MSSDFLDDGADLAEKVCSLIDEMRGCGHFDWAENTLTGIYDKCSERMMVSDGQRTAIRNILNGSRSCGCDHQSDFLD